MPNAVVELARAQTVAKICWRVGSTYKNRWLDRPWRRHILQRTALDVDRSLLNILAPVLMYCAILWWIGRRMSRARLLVVTAITLTLVFLVVLLERGWP